MQFSPSEKRKIVSQKGIRQGWQFGQLRVTSQYFNEKKQTQGHVRKCAVYTRAVLMTWCALDKGWCRYLCCTGT